MAYILIAVGALMAAAGLYVVGYGWLEARYDEYWAVVGPGATFIAGGMVTLAMGVAIRTLAQVRAALLNRAVASPVADEPSLSPISAAVSQNALAAAEPEPARIEHAEPELPLEPAAPAAAEPKTPHPLRPVAKPSTHADIAAAVAVAGLPEDAGEASETAIHAQDTAALHDMEHDDIGADGALAEPAEPHIDLPADGDIAAVRPADDYKLEMPSTPDHDLPPLAPATDDEPTETLPHAAPAPAAPASDDWLDRALADLDQELPLTIVPPRGASTSVPAPPRPDLEPGEPRLEPALAVSEAGAAADAESEPPDLRETTPPAPPVIGRYEAEGTSYVMYADGSIEAQSNAGVYRFNSMAELKAFIEN